VAPAVTAPRVFIAFLSLGVLVCVAVFYLGR